MKQALTTRRSFIKGGIAAAALASSPWLRAAGANDRLVIGCMGTSRNSAGGDGRGAELARGFAAIPGVEVAYVCDVDERAAANAAASVGKVAARSAQPIRDFRRILDDKSVDALVIAAPDHWHGPATIMACAAGKHVYVEKPASHNAREGEWMVQAARKHDRRVQLGTQRRSWPGIVEGIQKVRGGAIGRVLLAKCYYFANRPSIGNGKRAAVPSWLDWNLWQGPAPERNYQDNIVHYNWHWFWHWGTSESGNNAVHMIDVARWGCGVDYPTRVTSAGGKYRYPDDDQETPDTNTICMDFGGLTITWEGRSWTGATPGDPPAEVAFYGEKGSMFIRGGGYSICDLKGKEIDKGSAPGGNDGHLKKFVEAIRGSTRLAAEIEEGYKSTLLCHLANIAYRTGRTIHFDPATKTIANDADAMKLWGREYRKGWEPRF